MMAGSPRGTEDDQVVLVMELGVSGSERLSGVGRVRLNVGPGVDLGILGEADLRVFIIRSCTSLIPAAPRSIEKTARLGDLMSFRTAVAPLVERAWSSFGGDPDPTPFSTEVGWARILGAMVAEVTSTPPMVEIVAEARREQVEYIVRRFSGDRRLTPETIATAIGVSRRTLYELAEPRFGGVSEYIRTTRALRASSMLADPAMTAVPISEIATTAGFSSTRHMARAVQSITGFSPNALRCEALAGEHPSTTGLRRASA